MMNGLDELIKVGDKINDQLTEIRESIGAPLGSFKANLPKMITEAELKKLAEGRQGEPIIIDDKFCIAYIKDHLYQGNTTDHDKNVRKNLSGCFTEGNKVHFYYCKTICYMKKEDRGKRYIANSDISNTQTIDLRDVENFETRLALCQFCIGDLIKNGRISTGQLNFRNQQRIKPIIAEYGDAQTLMHCVKLLYNGDDDARKKTEEFIKKTIRKVKV